MTHATEDVQSATEGAPLAAHLRPAALWRALPWLTGAAAVLLLLLAQVHRAAGAEPDRIRHAGALALVLAVAAVTLAVVHTRWRPPWLVVPAATATQHPLATAMLVSGIVAVLGLCIVGWLALSPPAVAASRYKAWDFLDKRWLAALYLLAVGLVYLPALVRRLLEPGAATLPRTDDVTAGPRAPRTALRALGTIAVGTLLALIYVAPLVPPTLDHPLDTHEMVHLGGLQAMSHGAQPFIGARTQYGPGQQIVTYRLVQSTELSVIGLRLAHLLLNFAAIALLFAVVLFAFGRTVGAAVILVALFISPLQVTSFVGWGLLLRWLAPVLVGALAPLVLWWPISASRQRIALAALGAACGALGWMAQENTSTAVLTLLLVLCGAVAMHRTTLRDALTAAAIFVLAEIATLLALLAALVGPAHLDEALALYRGGSGLVFAGITSTPWSDANTAWTQPLPGRGPAYQLIGWRPAVYLSGWRAAYFLTPYAILSLTALTLYTRGRPANGERAERHLGQLLGMLAAAASLDLLTLFRADATHFVGMSGAVPAVMVLSLVYLPSHLAARGPRRTAARLVLAAAFLLIYPFASANTEFRFRTAADPRATMAGVRAVLARWGSQPSHDVGAADSLLAQRLGFRPDTAARCCHFNRLTYAELARVTRAVHDAAAGRTVYVDTRRNYSAVGPVASAVYFLADLRPGSSFVEPMMSIWTDGDIATASAELARRPPDCLLTGDSGYVLTPATLRIYGVATTSTRITGSGATLVCRSRTTAAR